MQLLNPPSPSFGIPISFWKRNPTQSGSDRVSWCPSPSRCPDLPHDLPPLSTLLFPPPRKVLLPPSFPWPHLLFLQDSVPSRLGSWLGSDYTFAKSLSLVTIL